MTISTGTRKERNVQTRSNEALIEADKEYINSLKIFSEASNSVAGLAGTPAQNSPKTPAGNYLAREGDSMIGPLALGPPIDFRVVIDSDNTIDIGSLNENAQFASNIELDSIQPNSFVLDIIANAAFDGQLLYIRTFGPTSFTISQGTVGNGGNIQTGDGANITLVALQVMQLIFDESLVIGTNTGGTWRIVSVSSDTGGGGGISFPIDFPEDDRGTVTISPQDILFTANTRHSVKMITTVDLTLTFTAPPTNETAYSNIIIAQDGTGGHTLTLPAGTVNKDTVEAGFLTGIDEETGIVIKFAFGIFYAFLETGNVVSGGAGIDQWSTFPAIQTVSMATNGMTGLTIANIVDTGSVARGSISGDPTLGLVLSTASGGKFSIQDVITPIATFDDTTGLQMEGTHGINMNKNIINTIGQTQFDRTVAFSPTIETGISFDNTLSAINYNVGLTSDVHTFRAAGELLASITRIGSNLGQIQASALIANNILQASEILFLASFNNTTPSNGDVWRDSGTGNFQFRQNGVTEELGGSGEFFGPWTATHDAGGQLLDNLGNLNTDAANLPTSGKFKLGNDELISWVKTDNVSVVSIGLRSTNLFSLTGANLSLVGNDIVDTNLLEGRLSNPLNINVPTSGQPLNFQFEGVTEWTLSQSTLGGDSIILNNSFILNSSGVDPNNDGQFTRNVDSVILQSPTTQFQRVVTGTNSGQLALVKVDAAPSGGEAIYRINFKLFDSPTSITYAQIQGGIKDATDAGILDLNVRADGVSNVNALTIEGSPGTTGRTFVSLNTESRIGSDLKFQAEDASDLKIFPALQQLGIVVQDNLAFTVGVNGMIAIPIVNSLSASAAAADTAFGNHKGALGFLDNETDTITLFARQINGNWAAQPFASYDFLS